MPRKAIARISPDIRFRFSVVSTEVALRQQSRKAYRKCHVASEVNLGSISRIRHVQQMEMEVRAIGARVPL